jgi:Zn-dependent protease
MDLGGLIRSIDWYFLKDTALRVLAVLLCLTVHEICHGLAAYALGDPTARDRRRLSLNPLRHIDWLGLAMMLFAGFGWAKPVPVDPRYFKKPKQGMALTALAGPVSNLLLAFLAMLFCHKVLDGLVMVEDGAANLLYIFLHLYAAPLSIGLGLFNLLPIPPLDGAKVLGAFLPDRTYFGLMRYERYGMFLLLALSWFGVTGDLISGAIQGVYWFFLELCL